MNREAGRCHCFVCALIKYRRWELRCPLCTHLCTICTSALTSGQVISSDDVGVVPCLFFPSSEHDGRSAGVSRLTGGSRLHARRRRRVKCRGSRISATGIKAAAESRASANTRRADKQSAILCHAPTGCALSGVR